MESECSATADVCLKDKKYIDELEKEVKNCSIEIEYLQDQLGVRNFEANCMGKHVHSLEQKLAAVGTLHSKVKLFSEELMQCDTKCLLLTQEIKIKDDDLQCCAIRIEELETALSSAALESQCEIESIRLDMVTLEEKCIQAESLSEQIGQEKAKMHTLLEEYEVQFYEAQDKISLLEMENNELKVKLNESERRFKELHGELEELFSSWIKQSIWVRDSMPGDNLNILSRLKDGHSSFRKACPCVEISCPLFSNLTVVMATDKNVKGEMERMSNLMLESELLVQKLKEELRDEKKKAKEEAEDLTQEMAELRYEITGMLEDECKRRASIEQASLKRIQYLEEEVRKEQRKSLSTMRHLRKVHEQSERQRNEIQHLLKALEGYRQIMDLELAQKMDSCGSSCCDISETSLDCLTKTKEDSDITLEEDLSFPALSEWCPDSGPVTEDQCNRKEQVGLFSHEDD